MINAGEPFWMRGLLCVALVAAQVDAADLGDFTGNWRMLPDSGALRRAQLSPDLPGEGLPASVRAELPWFRPEVATRFGRPGGVAPSVGSVFCSPPVFVGRTGHLLAPGTVLPLTFEILSSPNRLTVLDELGLIRRIHLQDAPPAGTVAVSNSGTSLARWQGDTLVVETTGLNPHATVVSGIAGTELGPEALVVERFTRVGADELEIAVTLSAPALYSAPVTMTNRYRRNADWHLVAMEICSLDDRAFDHAQGVERFDTTPPPDLPPPPAE